MWPTSLLWASLALAQSTPDTEPRSAGLGGCEPIDEPAFRSYVLDAQSAIDRGDVELPAAILAEIDGRVACLTFAPSPRMWADLLVARAIVEFSRGGDWEDAMAAALRIRPAIDRGLGPGHPLAQWEPPPPPPGGAPVPDGARIYVDGFPAATLPPAQGLYLVQKTDGRYWNTLLVHDEPIAPEWVEGPVEQRPRIRSWGRIGLLLGAGRAQQLNSWGSDVYPSAKADSVVFGGSGDLQLTFFSPFGALVQGRVTYGSAFSIDGRLGAIWAWKGLTLGGGVGSASVSIFERVYGGDDARGDTAERVRRLQYGHGTALIRGLGRARWDLGLTVGGAPSLVRYELGAGLLLPVVSGERYRLGLVFDGRNGAFVQPGPDEREVSAAGNQLLFRIDWVRGEY
jgi:hypothetical protein